MTPESGGQGFSSKLSRGGSTFATRASYVRRAFTIILASAGGLTAIWAVLLVVQGLIPAAVVYVTKWLVDAVAGAVTGLGDDASFWTLLLPASAMGGLLLLERVASSAQQWVQGAQSEHVVDHIKELIHEKASEIDYAFYETPAYFDRLEQANSQAGSNTLGLLRNLGTFLQSGITFLSIALILMHYGIWIPVLLLAGTVPALYVVVVHNRRHHAWWKRRTVHQRWAQYFDILLTRQETAPEIRALGLAERLRQGYRDLRSKLRSERLALLRSQTAATVLASVVALVTTGAAMVWMVLRAVRGLATLGDIALFYQAFNQGQSIVRNLLNSAGQIYTNSLFLEHLFAFLDQEPDIERPSAVRATVSRTDTIAGRISFQDVTFTYPGSEKAVLEKFSLDVPARGVVAIVGDNGAGKSTLTKLLLRLYDPDDGVISIGGEDIRSVPPAVLRHSISIMFQVPIRYQASVAENVGYGDLNVMSERGRVLAACRAAGAESLIAGLPKGIDTQLGKLFEGGVELSGGEWQRVALARAFLRQAPILVLDEPTSFMDSWAEAEWFDRFRQLAHGKTCVIITHRFTTAMQADVIHVMRKGRIIESGSHAELVRLGGTYAASWRRQTSHGSDGMDSDSLPILETEGAGGRA